MFFAGLGPGRRDGSIGAFESFCPYLCTQEALAEKGAAQKGVWESQDDGWLERRAPRTRWGFLAKVAE